jgi:type IV pilus assembly protein PilQ
MVYINSAYPRGRAIGVLLSALLIFGCAGNETVKKDAPFEKWKVMAETQTGSSPAPRDRSVSMMQQLATGTGEAGDELKTMPVRELPTQPVSLKMRQADVKTILRSLARVVDKNVLVKSEIKGEMTIDFRDVPWNQAFNGILRTQGLTYTWEGDILRVMTLEDMEMDLKRKTQEQGIKWVAPLLTVVIPIDYAKPKDLKENLESFLTRNKEDKPRGSVRVDEHSNSLIISAIKDDLLKMMPVIEKIDKPTPQIQIQANIVETTKDTARNLGIQWGGMYNPRLGNHDLFVTPGGTGGSAIPPGSALAGTYTPTYGTRGITGQGYGVNFPVAGTAMTAAGGVASLGLMFGTIGGNILDLQLNALQQDGKLNILSSPSITTMDNQLAFTENGERVPFSTLDTSVTPPIRTVKFEDAVLRLEITPHVIDGRNLSMKILVKKDEVDTTPGRTVEGNPYIIKKQTSTSLIVQDGETIVISGLTKQRNLQGTSGVPGLKDVPFLGWLFKGESKGEKMEEVLIFITPKILPPFQFSTAPAGTQAPAKQAAETAAGSSTPAAGNAVPAQQPLKRPSAP